MKNYTSPAINEFIAFTLERYCEFKRATDPNKVQCITFRFEVANVMTAGKSIRIFSETFYGAEATELFSEEDMLDTFYALAQNAVTDIHVSFFKSDYLKEWGLAFDRKASLPDGELILRVGVSPLASTDTLDGFVMIDCAPDQGG